MFTNIDITYLKNMTFNVDDNLQDFLDYIKKSKQIVEDMNNSWQGNDKTFFDNKMEGFFEDLTKLEASVETFNNFVKDYCKAYEVLEDYYDGVNSGKSITLK